LGQSKSIFYWKRWICRKYICNYTILPDDVEEAIGTNVKTTQHFNDVELDVQKADIFVGSDA
jgi:hypothetical protein